LLKKKLNYTWKFFYKKTTFKFGVFILYLLTHKLILNKQFVKFKLFLKKFIKKPEKSLKKLWITPVYIRNIALKSKGSRMGKGKGKKILNILRLYPGKPFIEFTNVRIGRIFYFNFFIQIRLQVKTLLLTNTHLSFVNIYKNSFLLQPVHTIK